MTFLSTLTTFRISHRAPVFGILFLVFHLVCPSTGFSQVRPIGFDGAPCAGTAGTFYLAKSFCTSISWSISGGTITSGQGTSTIHVTAGSSGSLGATVWATCSGVSKSYDTTVSLSPVVTPSVTLAISPLTVCTGGNITLTPAPINGGTPYYNYYVDGANVHNGTESSYAYATTGFSGGTHSAYVTMSTSLACFTSNPVSSPLQNFTVTARSTYTVTINNPPPICSGPSSAGMSVDVSGSDGGPFTYQWYKNSTQIGSSLSVNYTTISPVSTGDHIYCVVMSGGSCSASPVQSDTYAVTVTPSVTPTVGIDPSTTNYCSGDNITFSVIGTGINGSSTYLWSNGSTASTVTMPASSTAGSGLFSSSSTLSVTVSGLSGTCFTSNQASGSISGSLFNIQTLPTVAASDQTMCAGTASSIAISNPNTITGTTFSWTTDSHVNVGGYSDGSGSTISQVLSNSDNQTQGSLRYLITPKANGCNGSTLPVTVKVNPVPSISTTPSKQTICSGSSTSITVSNPNAVSGTVYSWTINPNNLSGESIGTYLSSFTNQLLTSSPSNVQGSIIYTFTPYATTSSVMCAGPSSSDTVTVNPYPQLTVASPTLFVGNSTALIPVSNVIGATTNYTYTPTIPTLNVSGASGITTAVPVSTAIAQALTLTDGINPGSVTFTLTSSVGTCSNSNSIATATVYVYPQPIMNANGTAVYMGSAVDLSAQPFYDTYSWHSTSGVQTGSHVLTIDEPGIYYVTVGKNEAQSGPSNSVTINGQTASFDQNYIIANSPLVATSNAAHVSYMPADSIDQTVQYFDGIGRPMQSVTTQASPLGKDLVQPIGYDAFGRESTKYLPYAAGSDNSGTYKATATADQFAFYQSTPAIASDTNAYAKTVFELSPLNRVAKQGAPGTTWQPIPDPTDFNDKSIKKNYLVNQVSDSVLLFTYDAASGLAMPPSTSALQYYSAGQLAVNKTTDEHGNEAIEFVDKIGHTVLKKVQYKTVGSNKFYTCTYYVYDIFGNLAVVLPPEAIKRILASK